MFDGAGVATLSTVATEPLAQSQAEALSSPEDVTADDALPNPAPTGEPQFSSSDQALFDALAAYDTSSARQEIVFLSPSVRDYHKLLDGISPNVEVFVLDPIRDGVQQMAEVLAGRRDLDAIHIISHGSQAELTLGTARLTLESMNGTYTDELAVISQSLSEKADLLIYGCNFGQGELGGDAAARLAQLTGADVAASVDLTGHADLGGDWDLEYSVGSIETGVAFTSDARQTWDGLLLGLTSTGEFTVNDPSGNDEETSGPVRGAERAVDIASNGDYVVVWTDETTSDKVLAKVLDKDGNEKIAQFQVNTGGVNNQWADVAVDDSGNFVITWTSSGDVYIRRFLANGTAVDGADVQVNTTTSNSQQNSSVNMNNAGDFVIAWEGNGGANEGIFVRQGSFGGGLIGSDIAVDTVAAAQDPSVGIADSGNFVVVWDDGNGDVFFQRYNSAGTPQTSGQVDGVLQFNAGGAAVDMSGDGRFTVAYRATGLALGIYARQFDAAGTPLFVPLLVNTTFANDQTNPSVSLDDSGDFIVVWEGHGDQVGNVDANGVFGQKFTSTGTRIGSEFLVNQTTANVQDRASVAMLDSNNFVVVWTGSDGAQTDVFARQFGTVANTPPTLDLDANNSSGATGNNYLFTFTEGDAATAIADTDTDLVDADSPTFASVTLAVSGLLDGNAETLVLDGDTFALATAVAGQNTTGGNYRVVITTGSGTAALTITKQGGGTFSEIETETLIEAIQYRHTDASAPTDGDRLIDVTVNDGTADSAAARTTININPMNDAPVVTAPGAALSATEQVGLAIHGTGFGVSDVDAGGGSATATLNVGEGTLSVVAGTSGVTIVGGNGTGTVTLSGTIAQINNLLTGGGTGTITYLNELNAPSASTTLTVTVNDQGNTGADPGLTGTGTTEEGTNSVTINLSAVNDDPTNVGSLPTDVTVTEDVLSNVDLSLIDLSDVDAGGGSLTVTLTTATGGNLTAVSGGGVTVAGSGTGVLTLTGTHANLNTYLNSATNVQYLHGTANTNGNNVDTITVQVSDNGNTGSGGGGNLTLGTVNVDITAQNDAPVVAGAGGTLAYTEGDGPQVIDATLTVTDGDDTNIESATISLTGGFVSGEDVLAFTNTGTITGSYNPGTGVLTLMGTDTLANYEAALESLTYENTNTSNPNTGARTVSWVVNDGTTSSAAVTSTITVAAVNDAPTTTDVSASGTEDAASIAITLTGVDVDGTVASFDLSTLPVNGTLYTDAGLTTLAATAVDYAATGNALTLYFVPAGNWNGVTTFQYAAKDNVGVADSTPATATLTVTVVNDPPSATITPASYSPTEQTNLTLHGTGLSVADVDAGSAPVTATLSVGEGVLNVAAGTTGVTVGGSGTGSVTLTGTLAQINDLLAGNNSGTVVYVNGSDTPSASTTLTLSINDAGNTGGGPLIGSDTATINITPVNDPPVITSNGGGATALVNVDENQAASATITSADVDGGVPMYSIVGGADAALFTLNATTGALTFNNVPDFEAPVDAGGNNVYEVTVQVADGSGGTDIQALTIAVTDVNEGLPPPPPIPPSLVPQPPAPPSGAGPPPAGSPPLSPVVVPAPVSPKPNSEVPFVPVPPGNDPDGTALLSSEMPGAPHPKGLNTLVPSVQLMREMRGYVEEGVAPRIDQADEGVRRAFVGQTVEKESVLLSEAFRRSLGIVEEDLRRATDMSESNLKFAVGVTNLGGVSLTAGVIAWLLRSGALLASLAATLPAWRHFDPLPVVLTSDRTRRRSTADAVVAADQENKQFRGLRDLLDKKGDKGRSEGEGREG
jgi:hypothetical protein